jgi:serine-aspartate repeat-containing protein C/D/E
MQEGQDWCLQCGTAKQRLLGGGPGWRTGIAILGSTAVLVCGAAVAAYAALNKTKPKSSAVALIVKSSPTGIPSTSTPTTGAASTPGATFVPGTPTTVKATPPKIPLQTPTPKSTGGADTEANNALFPPETKTTKTTATTKTTNTGTTGEPTKSTSESKQTSGSETKTSTESEAPSPILLDTNAASVYNPYNYPASLFGDPSLAIDGEVSSAWTAQIQASSAPKMAEGLLLDLKTPQKLGSAVVKTTTIGITVEVYGANGSAPPTSISDPAWARIVGLKILKKKNTTLTLKTKGKGYRYILLWLAKGPASSNAASPGSVSINEFELFPPK